MAFEICIFGLWVVHRSKIFTLGNATNASMANSLSHLLKKTRTIETVKRSKERRRKENDGSGKKEKKEGLHHRFERAEVRDEKKLRRPHTHSIKGTPSPSSLSR